MTVLLTGLLIALAGVAFTRRYLAARRGRTGLSDDAIRQIEAHGRVDVDEPLDLGEAAEEERRFWEEESWDESEEW